jgi:hypothetical protein
MVRMWDLTTNTCVRTFAEGHEFFATSLAFVADHVVSLALEDETLRIWTLTGTCKHVIRIGVVLHPMMNTAGQEVFFHELDTKVFHRLDVLSGEVRALHDESAFSHLSELSVYGLFVSGNWVLAMMQNREDEEESRLKRGISVFHRSSFAQESFLRGDFVSINICDNGDVVLATQDGRIDVMQLNNDGLLLVRYSFRVQFTDRISRETSLLLVVGSLVYVNTTTRHENEILVYDLCTGKRERTMCFPRRNSFSGTHLDPMCIAINGSEIFVGYITRSAIKAYLL